MLTIAEIETALLALLTNAARLAYLEAYINSLGVTPLLQSALWALVVRMKEAFTLPITEPMTIWAERAHELRETYIGR